MGLASGTDGASAIKFKPMSPEQKNRLHGALLANADDQLAILMDRKDTSFAGVSTEVHDEEVISAIKSVPCHYSM
jgi:hypothetical protein